MAHTPPAKKSRTGGASSSGAPTRPGALARLFAASAAGARSAWGRWRSVDPQAKRDSCAFLCLALAV
ncbi:MAG: hypothetical protein LKI44_08975, partial [Actinomyces sp.]|nr:hypothetical protein [Actinomyces sp.]